MKYHRVWVSADGRPAFDFPQSPYELGLNYVISGLEPDEQIFVLRAKDTLALATLNLYRSMSEGLFETAKAEDLERLIDRFIAWRHGNRALIKDPD